MDKANECRQIKWRKEQKAKGRCVQCGNKARKKTVKGKVKVFALCPKCGDLNNERAAARRKSNLTVIDKARQVARAARRGNTPRTRTKAGGCACE